MTTPYRMVSILHKHLFRHASYTQQCTVSNWQHCQAEHVWVVLQVKSTDVDMFLRSGSALNLNNTKKKPKVRN